MKTIGLLGGMSWESTVQYYRGLNQGVGERLGGLHSARIVMHSVDFQELEQWMRAGNWAAVAGRLTRAALSVQAGGADFFLICTNTMHKLADVVRKAVDIPLLHIADAAAEHALGKECRTVGLLGTAFTMEEDFYTGRLKNKFGMEVLVPEKEDRALVDTVIFDELCLGRVKEASKVEYLRIIEALRAQGAQAVILGCTEIGMLVEPKDTDVLLLDTTRLHVEAALDFALA